MFFSSHHWIYNKALRPITGFALMAAGMALGLSACVAPQHADFANLEPQAIVKDAPEYQGIAGKPDRTARRVGDIWQ